MRGFLERSTLLSQGEYKFLGEKSVTVVAFARRMHALCLEHYSPGN